MKILNITAQKPHSTGSGVYMTELINGFSKLGHKQAVIAGVCKEDKINFPEDIRFYPVYFQTSALPFPIAGMSDEMPYESTIYSNMTMEMAEQFEKAFLLQIDKAVSEFTPDIILCHHLYFLTALVRSRYPEHKIIGICHGTDLRQLKKHTLKHSFILKNIAKLDYILALQKEQRADILDIFHPEARKVQIIGSGYNNKIFYHKSIPRKDSQIRLIFAGKISEKKGIKSLIKALDYLTYKPENLALTLVGGHGNKEEYKKIKELARECKYSVYFPGKLTQEQLADEFNKSDIFILPSFYEGLPLVIIEALACGLKVISTNIPGVKEWIDENIRGNNIRYVPLPRLLNTDEPVKSDLPDFERKLAVSIEESASDESVPNLNLCSLSWLGLCRKIECLLLP